MGQMLLLSLRQLAGVRRLAIVLLLALLPVGLSLVIRLASGDDGDDDDFINGLVDALLVGGIMPIVAMTMATASFGNELEDRTLSYIVLKPVPRWRIVLPKLIAPILIAGPVVLVSGAVTALIGLDTGPNTPLAVGAALLIGVVTYSAVFTWAGLMTTRALSFAIVYVFLWEGLVSSLIGGVRYLSVRGYTLAVMYGLDRDGLESMGDRVIEFPAAIGGAALVSAVFFCLTVRRLKRMDVP